MLVRRSLLDVLMARQPDTLRFLAVFDVVVDLRLQIIKVAPPVRHKMLTGRELLIQPEHPRMQQWPAASAKSFRDAITPILPPIFRVANIGIANHNLRVGVQSI